MILALDSSQNSGSIALQEAGKIVYSSYFDIRITHSETLLPEIDHALKICGVSQEDLNEVVLAIGPGSFTGLRIGLATAKGISYGRKIPIRCFDSLKMLAFQGYAQGSDILAVIDAKMSELYVALYDQHLNEIRAPYLSTVSEIAGLDLDRPLVLGSAAQPVVKALEDAGKAYRTALTEQNIDPAVALLGLNRLFPATEDYDFARMAELEPLYLRESTAQIKRNQKAKA